MGLCWKVFAVVFRAETGGDDTQIQRISLVFLVAIFRGWLRQVTYFDTYLAWRDAKQDPPFDRYQLIISDFILFIYRAPKTTPSSVSDIASLARLFDGDAHRLLDGVVVDC